MSKSLEELTFNEKGKIVDSSGTEVSPVPVGVPVTLSINKGRSYARDDGSNDTAKILTENAPAAANAYIKGRASGAPVVRPPYWDYLPVQFYKI